MIILIGGKKGGSGKSTITMNLASELARQKKDVMIVDTDRQSSTAEWATERIRNQSTLPEIFCVQKYNEIHTTLLNLNKRYEYVLVDTAGRDAPEFTRLPTFSRRINNSCNFNSDSIMTDFFNALPNCLWTRRTIAFSP